MAESRIPVTMAPPLVRKPVFLGVLWAGTVICTASLAFRYFVRMRYFRRLLVDDYFAGVAWVLLLSTAITWTVLMDDVYEIKYVLSGLKLPGNGFIHSLEEYLHGSMAVLMMFYLGLWTVKINFLVFFYQLGSKITAYRIYWWTVTIFTIAAGFVCVGTIQYQCLAVSVQESMAKCSGASAVRFQDITLKVNCGLDVFTDALIMSMPIYVLWNVRISLKRKFQLGALFSLVVITMAVAIVRVVVVSKKDSLSNRKQVEITWLYLWHFIESCVAILVACLASFRTLFAVKDRIAEAEEKVQRENEQRGSGPNVKVLRARAKFLQESLFNSVKSTTGGTKIDNNVSNSMEYPLREVRTASTGGTASPSMQDLPVISHHGLLP